MERGERGKGKEQGFPLGDAGSPESVMLAVCLMMVLEPSKFKNVNFDVSVQETKIKALTCVCQVESGLEGAVGLEPGKLVTSATFTAVHGSRPGCSAYSPSVVRPRAGATFRRCGSAEGN